MMRHALEYSRIFDIPIIDHCEDPCLVNGGVMNEGRVIQVGRPAGDPLNDTGVDMPPRGGNPSLSDEDLAHIVAYLRTLQ